MKSKKRKESMNPSAVVPKENERNKQRVNPSKEDVILEKIVVTRKTVHII